MIATTKRWSSPSRSSRARAEYAADKSRRGRKETAGRWAEQRGSENRRELDRARTAGSFRNARGDRLQARRLAVAHCNSGLRSNILAAKGCRVAAKLRLKEALAI